MVVALLSARFVHGMSCAARPTASAWVLVLMDEPELSDEAGSGRPWRLLLRAAGAAGVLRGWCGSRRYCAAGKSGALLV